MNPFKVRYFIRMDDVSPFMDHSKFDQLLHFFFKKKIQPLLGVIPDNQDRDLRLSAENHSFWPQIHTFYQEGKIDIAMHGYQHLYCTKISGNLNINPFSEFAGLPYSAQYEKLKKGIDILSTKGFPDVDTFMAPGHSFDGNTIQALEHLNFNFVTDGLTLYPFLQDNLIFLPCQTHAPFPFVTGAWTLCLHSDTMSRRQIEKLQKFVTENIDLFHDYSSIKRDVDFYHSPLHTAINKLFSLTFPYIKKLKNYAFR
jgi:predicted deacetylase